MTVILILISNQFSYCVILILIWNHFQNDLSQHCTVDPIQANWNTKDIATLGGTNI